MQCFCAIAFSGLVSVLQEKFQFSGQQKIFLENQKFCGYVFIIVVIHLLNRENIVLKKDNKIMLNKKFQGNG